MNFLPESAREVMLVIGSLQRGGTELHLARIAPGLVRKGWRVSIYSLSGAGPLAEDLAREGVSVLTPPLERGQVQRSLPDRILRLAVASAHLLYTFMRRKPDVAHFFLPAAYLVGAPLALAARVPSRLMSRRSLNDYQRGHPILAWIERNLHRTMTAILGNSKRVVEQLRDEEGVSPQRLGLIYNGLDVAAFARRERRDEVRRALAVPPESLTFAVLANLIAYKGHADLIEAFAIANSRLVPGWRLLVIGRDDGLGAVLRTQAERAGIADNIVMLGQRIDTPDLLAAADVGILCSHQEGFSNAILEKMASGLPMIVTDVGGNGEAVLDGITGIVVPAHDPQRMAAAIENLASSEALRMRYGTEGQARVSAQFTIEQCVNAYDGLYQVLLAGGQVRDAKHIALA